MKIKIALITLAVLVLALGGLKYIKNKQETSNVPNKISTIEWKTYTNKLLKIEIKYPSDYTVYQRIEDGKLLLADQDSPGFNIIKTDNIPKLFCCEASILAFDIFYHPEEKFPGSSSIVFNEKKAWQRFGSGSLDNNYRTINVRDGLYSINIYEAILDNNFEKIIESLVFLK